MSKSLALRASTSSSVVVDRGSGLILGCAVITIGETRPSAGDGSVMLVDATTLDQVAGLINASPIKVRLSHVELDGVADDIGHRVAFIEKARVVGDAVRADVRFLSPDDSAAQRVMAIVETDPSAIGLSISTSGFELHPPRMTLRVTRLDAVDLVSTPAANPAGMLSAETKPLKKEPRMIFNDDQMSRMAVMGLTEGEDADAFYESLSAEQKAEINAAASGDEVVNASAASGGAVLAERKRASLILGMASRAGMPASVANEHVSAGTSVADFAPLTLSGRSPADMRTHTHTTTSRSAPTTTLTRSALRLAALCRYASARHQKSYTRESISFAGEASSRWAARGFLPLAFKTPRR